MLIDYTKLAKTNAAATAKGNMEVSVARLSSEFGICKLL